MTTNFGSDLSSLDELDETREVTGVELVAQDAFWALQTPPGMGILAADAPDHGMDLLELIGSVQSEADAASLPGRIRATLKRDERVDTVDSDVTRIVEGPAVSYDILIRCKTITGESFELVGHVADEALQLAIRLLPGGV